MNATDVLNMVRAHRDHVASRAATQEALGDRYGDHDAWVKARDLSVQVRDLDVLVAARGLPTVDDPSNRDPRFDRALIRAALAASDLLDASAAAASAAHLAQEEAALAWVTAELAAARISSDGAACHVDMARLPPALRRRLLIAALTTAGEPAPRGEAVEGAMAAVARGEQAMIGNRLLSADSDLWTIRPAPPRRATTPRSD